jgi:hypothetical protein
LIAKDIELKFTIKSIYKLWPVQRMVGKKGPK